jgi:hypothetical protein
MSLLVWAMMGIAVWHFTVFVPDRFWGGIVGAFLAAAISATVFGLIVNGGGVPGRHDTHVVQALIAIPGAVRHPSGPQARRRPRQDARRRALGQPGAAARSVRTPAQDGSDALASDPLGLRAL